MHGLVKKTMERAEWPRVLKRKYVYENYENSDFTGSASLLTLLEIREPLLVKYKDTSIKIVEKNYQWLQMAYKDKYYWLSTMFNDRGEIIQYYFDITYGNYIEPNGKSWFYDLYLDVTVQPNGEICLLDEDELQEALDEGSINREQFELAYETAYSLMKELEGNIIKLEAFCMDYYKKLK